MCLGSFSWYVLRRVLNPEDMVLTPSVKKTVADDFNLLFQWSSWLGHSTLQNIHGNSDYHLSSSFFDTNQNVKFSAI